MRRVAAAFSKTKITRGSSHIEKICVFVRKANCCRHIRGRPRISPILFLQCKRDSKCLLKSHSWVRACCPRVWPPGSLGSLLLPLPRLLLRLGFRRTLGNPLFGGGFLSRSVYSLLLVLFHNTQPP